jgi:hypothetical protein
VRRRRGNERGACGKQTRPYPSHRRQSFRHPERNPTRFEKSEPERLGDVQPDVKLPSKSVGETLAKVSRGRDGLATVGGLFVDLKFEGLDDTQMDDLGGVTDEILAAQMEILAENEVSDSGKETVGDDSEDEESFSGRGTHNPAAPEFKSGARIVHLGQ